MPSLSRPEHPLPPSFRYLAAIAGCLAATGVILLLPRALWLSSGVLVYLLAVLGVAVVAGRGPAIVAALASFAVFDFAFIHPRFTFTISNPNEWTALVAYLVVAVVTSQLAAAQRDRYLDAEAREREARLLHDLTDLLAGSFFGDALTAVSERLRSELGAEAIAITIASEDGPNARAEAGSAEGRRALRAVPGPMNVLGEGRPATAGASGSPGRWLRVIPAFRPAGAIHRHVARVPIRRGAQEIGAVWVKWRPHVSIGRHEARLLDTAAGQIAVATEREELRQRAVDAEVLRRTSELKSALLDAVSHDLRTPLASIIAAADSLLQDDVEWTPDERRDFASAIAHEAHRLNRIVGNLLDLSRIQGGALVPARQWHDPASVLRASLRRLDPMTREHRLVVSVPDELPPVLIDPVEVDQVVANLIENAVKYTPAGGDIRVLAAFADGELRVAVEDSGPGLPAQALPRLFEPFYRAAEAHLARGSGVGLAVARGLVDAHGGRIWAENLSGGGARFSFAIPSATLPSGAAP